MKIKNGFVVVKCCGEKWFCSTRGWNGRVEKWKKPVRGSGKMSNMKKGVDALSFPNYTEKETESR